MSAGDRTLTATGPAPSAAGKPATLVELRELSVRAGSRTVLERVTLTVGRGEFLAVLGPNGAGKSTLMRAILGLVPPAAGSIAVLGAAPVRARARIGYLPQRHNVDQLPRIRGVDLVRLGLDGHRWGMPLALTPAARARHRAGTARVEEVIALVGAGGYAERPIGEMSGGERQRLLIAQALVRRPELLILDEPLDSLDLPNQISVAALIGRICATQGVSALLVAHDVNPLLGHLHRVVYLGGGTAVAGPVDEVINASTLTGLYGTPVEVLRTHGGRLVVVGQPEAPHHHGHRHE